MSDRSIIALATIGTVEKSTDRQCWGGITEVALAAEVPVVTTLSCAVDGLNLTVVCSAVSTPLKRGPSAADRHIVWRARPGRNALDIAKNLLGWRMKKCVKLPRKTSPQGLDFRLGASRHRRGIHYRLGDDRNGREIDGPAMLGRYHRSCLGGRGACRHDIVVRSGWSPVNGRGLY